IGKCSLPRRSSNAQLSLDEILLLGIPDEHRCIGEFSALYRHYDVSGFGVIGFRWDKRTSLGAVSGGKIRLMVRVRMVDDLELQVSRVDLLKHRELLTRVHQKGRACIPWKPRRVSGMFLILDIADRAR